MSQVTPPEAVEPRVLILFAHPALEKSRVNRHLSAAVRDLPGVTFHDLYEAYPDFNVHVDCEQELLLKHDIVVLHHPMFWYSTPALVKEWEDLVLQHGWAYGSEGQALVGKKLLSVITTGGREDAYREEGMSNFTIRQLLTPIEQTFRLCGMEYLPPFMVQGTLGMKQPAIDSFATDYRRVVEALRDDAFEFEKARRLQHLNHDLDAVLGGRDAR